MRAAKKTSNAKYVFLKARSSTYKVIIVVFQTLETNKPVFIGSILNILQSFSKVSNFTQVLKNIVTTLQKLDDDVT